MGCTENTMACSIDAYWLECVCVCDISSLNVTQHFLKKVADKTTSSMRGSRNNVFDVIDQKHMDMSYGWGFI